MTESLISSETIVSALLLSAAASLAAAAAIPSARQLANLCSRLTPMQVVVLLTAVSIATASAQKSGTNIVEGASNTNDVVIVLNTNGVDVVEGANSADDVGGSNDEWFPICQPKAAVRSKVAVRDGGIAPYHCGI